MTNMVIVQHRNMLFTDLNTGHRRKMVTEALKKVEHWQSPRQQQFRAVHSGASMKEAQMGLLCGSLLYLYLVNYWHDHEQRHVGRYKSIAG